VAYGTLTARQRTILTKHVRGKVVHDLGAGDLELSEVLVSLGAREVYAIDKMDKPRILPHKVHYKKALFYDLPATTMGTVFVSWPINYESNLVPHIKRAGIVIYLGCNTGGSACGTSSFFRETVHRALLDYEPDRHNTLLIVGRDLGGPRIPTGEEFAGMNLDSGMYPLSYEQSEGFDVREG
jgi:hypothetical protein